MLAAAASIQRNQSLQPNGKPPVPMYNHSPPPALASGSSSASGSQILSEKEILRRKFEAQDASVMGNGRPVPPQRAAPQGPIRPPPSGLPPVASGSRILSAMEEKARLKAKYEAEENAANGGYPPIPVVSLTPVPANPPPLMPRPPAEYIQETQEEDARVSRYVSQGITPPLELPTSTISPLKNRFVPRSTPALGHVPPPPPLPHNLTIQ
jgi:hypothetical protein